MFNTRGKHARPVRRAISASGVGLAAVMAAVLGLTTAGGASAATDVVNEDDFAAGTWVNDPSSTADASLSFVDTDAFIGTGSLRLATSALQTSKIKPMTDATDFALADLTALSYSTKLLDPTAAFAGSLPSLQLVIDPDGAGLKGFATLVYEPYYSDGDAADNLNVWQTWNALAGYWWTSAGINAPTGMVNEGGGSYANNKTLAQILAANPDAVVAGYGFSLGTYQQDNVSLVDNLTVNGTIYDFEKKPFDKDSCKDGGWATNWSAGSFKNQGDCVSYFASEGATHKGL